MYDERPSPEEEILAHEVVLHAGVPVRNPRVVEPISVTELVRRRSMLVILIAACKTAETAFQAADNAVDAALLDDLSTMIVRSEAELEKLSAQLAQNS